MDSQTTVHGVAKALTGLSDQHTHTHLPIQHLIGLSHYQAR